MMKKQQIKKAFSLPELLIVMGIVGVISVIMLTIIKPNEIALKYQYYNAYNTLQTAAKNVFLDAEELSTSSTASAADKAFPATPADLCKKLAVNPASPNSKYGYINSTVYNCSSLNTVGYNAGAGSFTDDKIAFTASNSMRYFISPLYNATLNSSVLGSVSLNYFIVWVDINGGRNPNTPVWTGKKVPDVVPFVVASNGVVVPIGHPTVDIRYTTARAKIVVEDGVSYGEPTTFYNAQVQAFGNYQEPSTELFSVRSDWQNLFKNTNLIPYDTTTTKTAIPECVPQSGNYSSCTVLIDEQKTL